MKVEIYGDIMFYELNFENIILTFVSSVMSTGIIVNHYICLWVI